MRLLPVLFVILAAVLWNTPAASEPGRNPARYELVVACYSRADATGFLDLAEQRKREAAQRLFLQLNRSPVPRCGVRFIGSVTSVAVIKKYPPLPTLAENALVEAWVVEVHYHHEPPLYLILSRVVFEGRFA